MKCPICEFKENNFMSFANGVTATSAFGIGRFECKNCQFIYSDYIDPKVLSFFYNYFSRDRTPESIAKIRENAKANGLSQLEVLKPFLPANLKRTLDFGGGYGENAKLFLSKSDYVYITEEDESCHEQIKKEPKLQILKASNLHNNKFIGYFDLLILSNVLEHLTLPRQQLQHFSRIISEGGILFIEVPCEAKMLKETSRHGRQHVGFYTVDNFKLLIKKQGSFDILDIGRYGQSINKCIKGEEHDGNYSSNEDGYEIRAILRNSRPNLKPLNTNHDPYDKSKIIENLSHTLYCFAQDNLRRQSDKANEQPASLEPKSKTNK